MERNVSMNKNLKKKLRILFRNLFLMLKPVINKAVSIHENV